jgi:hypothetical protein
MDYLLLHRCSGDASPDSRERLSYICVVLPTGFEPAASCLTGRRALQTAPRKVVAWSHLGSNQGPLACRASARTAELCDLFCCGTSLAQDVQAVNREAAGIRTPVR